MSSSLLLFPQRFGRYVLRPSSAVCRTPEPSRNFELRPLLNPRGGACSDSVSHNRVQVRSSVKVPRVRQTPEEGRRTYRPKRCGNNYKDEDNSLKTLNDKNHQASSQKFRHLRIIELQCLTNEFNKLSLIYFECHCIVPS